MPTPFHIKIADVFCRLTVEDGELLTYMKKEFIFSKSNSKDIFNINIKRRKRTYLLTSGNIKKIIRTDNKKNISFVLMSFIAYKTIEKNIFFIHASAIEKNSMGYIFAGPSGVGKSTLIKNMPYEKIYSEDMAILKKNKDGLYLYPSPFDKRFVVSIDKHPILIDKIFFLKQSDCNFISDIDFKSKIRIIRNEVYKTYRINKKNIDSTKILKTAKNFYNLAFKIIDSVKIENLNFKKNFNLYTDLA